MQPQGLDAAPQRRHPPGLLTSAPPPESPTPPRREHHRQVLRTDTVLPADYAHGQSQAPLAAPLSLWPSTSQPRMLSCHAQGNNAQNNLQANLSSMPQVPMPPLPDSPQGRPSADDPVATAPPERAASPGPWPGNSTVSTTLPGSQGHARPPSPSTPPMSSNFQGVKLKEVSHACFWRKVTPLAGAGWSVLHLPGPWVKDTGPSSQAQLSYNDPFTHQQVRIYVPKAPLPP